MLNEWLVAGGAQVRANDAGMAHGMIRAFHNRTYDVSKAVPTVVLRNEDFGRIARLLADGEHVELEFNILNQLHPAGTRRPTTWWPRFRARTRPTNW